MNQSKQMNTDLGVKVRGIPNRINSEIINLFNQSDFVSSERKGSSISIKVIKIKELKGIIKRVKKEVEDIKVVRNIMLL